MITIIYSTHKDSEGVSVFACIRDVENLINIAKEAHSNSFTI